MIHYNVWFSYKPGVNESDELTKVQQFLDDMLGRKMVSEFKLLKNRAGEGLSRLEKYHALIIFDDDGQFSLPFAEIREAGIHAGAHGSMIENVETFTIEVFEDE